MITIERAIEILTPDAFTRFSPSEYEEAASMAREALQKKRGSWEEKIVEDTDPLFRRRFYCSACGSWTSYGKTLYCPDCGADMRGEEHDEQD